MNLKKFTKKPSVLSLAEVEDTANEDQPTVAEICEIPQSESFPIECLPSIMRAIVKDIVRVYKVAAELPAIAALATLSGAIGKHAIVTGAVNGRETPCNIFAFIGAPRSSGKGSVASVIMEPLIQANQRLLEDYKQDCVPVLKSEKARSEKRAAQIAVLLADPSKRDKEGGMTVEELITEHRELCKQIERNEFLLKSAPMYFTGSATGAALVQAVDRNDGVLMSYSPEAGDAIRVVLGRYTSDGSADCDIMLSGYSNEIYTESRVGRGHTSIVPCLTTLWFAQPYLIRELLGNEEATERGLSARALIFVWEPDNIPEDDGVIFTIDEKAKKDWSSLVLNTLKKRGGFFNGESCVPTVSQISCSPEAKEIFRLFHNKSCSLRNGAFRAIEGELGRVRENAIRVAGIMAVAENQTNITKDIAERSVKILEWCLNSYLNLLKGSLHDKAKKRLYELSQYLAEANNVLPLRTLERSHAFKEPEIVNLVKMFPTKLMLDTYKPEGGGRPSKRLRLLAPII